MQLATTENSAGRNFSDDCADAGSGAVSCTYGAAVQPGDTLALTFPVLVSGSVPSSCAVAAGALSCAGSVVRVSGGGAASASMQTPTEIFETEAQAKAATVFGVALGGANTALSSVQAGAHPDITTTLAFDTLNGAGATAGDLKNIVTDEPPGFAVDFAGQPACQASVFEEEECPLATQVGVTTVIVDQGSEIFTYLKPLYSLAPEPGRSASSGSSSTGTVTRATSPCARPAKRANTAAA